MNDAQSSKSLADSSASVRARRARPVWPRVAGAVLLGAVFMVTTPMNALAQPSTPAGGKTQLPWYDGVSASEQAKAKALFREGVKLHKNAQFEEAASKYREALQYWDNPDIHFNLVQAYIELDRQIEAHDSLLAATRYGLDLMTPKDRVRARDYKRLLEGHLVELTVRCEEQCDAPDTEVTLDGVVLFSGKGRDTRWVLPGPHRVSARKAEYLDYAEQLQLAPGVPHEQVIELIPRSLLAVVAVSCLEPEAEVTLDDEPLMACPARLERELMSGQNYTIAIARPGYIGEHKTVKPEPGQRVEVSVRTMTIELESRLRWQRWKPLSVITVGLALGIAGGVYQNRSVSNMSDYDSRIDALCGIPIHGCPPETVPDDVHALKTDAERQNRMGVGLMLAGSAGIVAGLTLVYLNTPRAKRTERPSELARTVVPTVTKQGVGIATTIRF